ncbi:histone demethylase activity (H3-K9 specific) [Coemansia sp. RSA 451]|nr:histone demethylase activity (H3-K9 specific) [Coemansia sp. RSA 451]
MVECQQCGLTVHALCSALEVDDGNYRCANCEMDTDQLSCALCPFQNGLLLPVKHESEEDRGPEFVHFLCANFISETYFDGPPDLPTPTSPMQTEDRVSTRSRTAAQASQTVGVMCSSAKVCGVQSISKSRFTGKCMYCSDTMQCVGAVVQCSHAKCFRVFHPMCAAVCSRGLLDWSQYKAYCASHRGAS